MSTPNPANVEWVPLAAGGGPPGPTGPAGAAGDLWIYGTGTPSGGSDPNGTLYLDGATGNVWEKQSDSWVFTGISIKGPQGIQGIKGDTGSQGTQGIQGNTGSTGTPGEKWFSGTGAPAGATGIVGDWYLATDTGEVYEKTGASAWTSRGNIKGPKGDTGSQGIQGNPGTQGIQGPTGEVGPFRLGHTWSIPGLIAASTLPGIFIPKLSTQTITVVGVRAVVGVGSLTAQLLRNGSALGSSFAVTTTATTTTFSQALADLDKIGCTLSGLVSTPGDLSLTIILEHRAA